MESNGMEQTKAGTSNPLRVLVACEFSGIVRDAFAARGHDAWSCDLLPTERPGNHIQDDVLKHLGDGWDLMIAHPPCTDLAVCGAPSFEEKRKDGRQQKAISFFLSLIDSPVERIAVENPVCVMSSVYQKPDQIVEPWYFGDRDTKKICLWLKNLPTLWWGELFGLNPEPDYKWFKSAKTKSGMSRYSNVHERSKSGGERSRFFQGIANAMAAQWG
jgi:hypothetical protein